MGGKFNPSGKWKDKREKAWDDGKEGALSGRNLGGKTRRTEKRERKVERAKTEAEGKKKRGRE